MKAGILIGHLQNKGNEGAIIRTAEAFGVNNVFVVGEREPKYHSSEGCDRHVNFFEFKNYDDFITYVKSNNFHLVCIENINEAKELKEVIKYPANPIFITGHESLGVPKELLKWCNLKIKINQGIGYANCLNTGCAMGIVIHDFFNKEIIKRNSLWDMPQTRRK